MVRKAKVVLGTGTALLLALLAIAFMAALGVTAQTIETHPSTLIRSYNAGDRVSYTFPSIQVSAEMNVYEWDVMGYRLVNDNVVLETVGTGRSTETIRCNNTAYTLHGGDSFFDSFSFNANTRRLSGTLSGTLGTGAYGFGLSLDGTRVVSYTDVVDYDQTKVSYEDTSYSGSYENGSCGDVVHYHIDVTGLAVLPTLPANPFAGLTSAQQDAYCADGRPTEEPHWHYYAPDNGCHSHPPDDEQLLTSQSQHEEEEEQLLTSQSQHEEEEEQPLTSQRQSEAPPPVPTPNGNGLSAREQAIVDAMRTYTGNLNSKGLPWMRPLRDHAGISDINSSERARLWPIAQGG
jgi:hypothetical protein